MTRPSSHILAMALVAFGLTSCGESTPTQPTGPSVSGRWEGSYQITACVAAGSCVPSPCRFTLGQRSTLRLTLQQTAAQVHGSLELYLDDPFFFRTGQVSGAVDPRGTLGLGGHHHTGGPRIWPGRPVLRRDLGNDAGQRRFLHVGWVLVRHPRCIRIGLHDQRDRHHHVAGPRSMRPTPVDPNEKAVTSADYQAAALDGGRAVTSGQVEPHPRGGRK